MSSYRPRRPRRKSTTVTFDQAPEPADLVATLETFEHWFASRFDSDFFHVFERYQPDSRATDF